jgi:hypothetical protein
VSAFVLVAVRSTNQVSGNMLPPVVVPNGFEISFAGIPGRIYSLQRATNVGGPWITISPVPAGTSGLGTFTDTNPPPNNAYYRTTYP